MDAYIHVHGYAIKVKWNVLNLDPKNIHKTQNKYSDMLQNKQCIETPKKSQYP